MENKDFKKLKLTQLEKIAFDKHGRRAYGIVQRHGGMYRKDAWIKTIQEERNPSAEIQHSIWQQELMQKFPSLPKLEN